MALFVLIEITEQLYSKVALSVQLYMPVYIEHHQAVVTASDLSLLTYLRVSDAQSMFMSLQHVWMTAVSYNREKLLHNYLHVTAEYLDL